MAEYTDFAPAERLSKEEIINEYKKLLNSEIFNKQIFNKIPIIILILNNLRQVVFANDYFKKIAQINKLDDILGLRPGEVFNCIYSDITQGGCGTTKFCKYCGAVNAILASIKGVSDVRECTISQKDGNTIFLEVSASPVEFLNNFYVLFTIKDISSEKRKLYLEKQLLSNFFNNLSEIKIGSQMLKETIKDNEIIEILDKKVKKLLDDINFQKLILNAENFKLDINPITLNSNELLKEITEKFNSEKTLLIIDDSAENIDFVSDYKLLFLVLELGINYGLHTISKNKKVKISIKKDDRGIVISIIYDKVIPEKLQYKLFQKDYMNNIKDSRIETYLMNLITNRYLKGDISFISNKEIGTIFSIKLPFDLEEKLNLNGGKNAN